MSAPENLGGLSMNELFRVEVERQSAILTAGLLELEHDPGAGTRLEELMRAAHSLKGAARIIGLEAAVRVAHALEEGFVAGQRGQMTFQREQIDLLLRGVDLLIRIAQTPEIDLIQWAGAEKSVVDDFLARMGAMLGQGRTGVSPVPVAPPPVDPSVAGDRRDADRFLRVTAGQLDRLLGLTGESLVASRQLSPYADSLRRLKRKQAEVGRALDGVRETLAGRESDDLACTQVAIAQARLTDCRQFLGERLAELENFDRRSASLATRLHHEAVGCRMRPFADGLHGFARMVRDLAHSLGKEAVLQVAGENTAVDREILERLEAPLTHLLRNAVDHGLETPEQRRAAGKSPTGVIRVEARHSAGMLRIRVSDDGRGIPLGPLREAVARAGYAPAGTAAKLGEAELLEFLFLPGFSMKETVTEISGRGVGLDVVRSMAKDVRGTVRIVTSTSQGTCFQMQLPLTLSVVRTLLVEIGDEPYAFPLANIHHTLKVARDRVQSVEGRPQVEHEGLPIGLVSARQMFDRGELKIAGDEWPVVLLGGAEQTYGLVVDRFLGERELVVQPLDPRLGKIKGISAGALMEDGTPVLIVDTEDLVLSIEKVVAAGELHQVGQSAGGKPRQRKRVLVVDDSQTVRELERKVLTNRGYEVEVAVDGMDGWNAARVGKFDLIISDVDMPRMDGIEMISQIKRDPCLRSTRSMIVSYKERDEDRKRGLQAGADCYLGKGSFHDDQLLEAVVDLIGEAEA